MAVQDQDDDWVEDVGAVVAFHGPELVAEDGEAEVIRCQVGPNDYIVWYKSKGDFVAECGDPRHGRRCRRTRTSKAGTRMKPAQGRPLGHLLDWLQDSSEHVNAYAHVHACFPTYCKRVEARNDLLADPLAARLLSKERPLTEGEAPAEPDDLA